MTYCTRAEIAAIKRTLNQKFATEGPDFLQLIQIDQGILKEQTTNTYFIFQQEHQAEDILDITRKVRENNLWANLILIGGPFDLEALLHSHLRVLSLIEGSNHSKRFDDIRIIQHQILENLKAIIEHQAPFHSFGN